MRMTVVYLVTLAFVCTACTKKQNPPNSLIYGGWSPESAIAGRTLSFTEGGEIQYRQWDTVLSLPYKRYLIINDSVMHLYKNGISDKVVVTYKVDQLTLSLKGACIITCDEKFNRILATD